MARDAGADADDDPTVVFSFTDDDGAVHRVEVATCGVAAALHGEATPLGRAGVADNTGYSAWPALPLLSSYLLTRRARAALADAGHVVELGSGLGVPGLLASALAARVTLTDLNAAVLGALRRSVARLPSERAAAVGVTRLEWGAAETLPAGLRGAAGVVLAADCVYSEGATHALLETTRALLAPRGVAVLGYVSRWPALDRALGRLAASAGLVLFSALAAPPADLSPGSGVYVARRVEDAGAEAPWVERAAVPRVDADGTLRVVPGVGADSACWEAAGVRRVEVVGRGPLPLVADEQTALAAALRGPWGRTLEALELAAQDGALFSTTAGALASGGLRSLASLRLDGTALGRAGGEQLATALPALPALTSLDVSECELGDEGTAAIASALGPVTRVLALRSNAIGDRGADALAACLRGMPVEVLELDHNDVTGEGASGLADALAHAPHTVRVLKLLGNPLEPYGGDRLGVSLHMLLDLEELDVRACNLGDAGFAPLAAKLPALPRLRALRAASNGLGNRSAASLAEALGGCTALTHVSLSMGTINEEGARVLAEALPGTAVRELELRGHALADEGLEALAEWIPDTALRVLDVRSNRIGDDGAVALAEWLPESRLERVELGDGVIGERGAAALADAARRSAHLTSVGLAANFNMGAGAAALEAAAKARAPGAQQLTVRLPKRTGPVVWGA